jgi:pyruvate/2-oxoglutarate/acetoin dehydrogenase E1 component
MWYNAASLLNYAAKSREMWSVPCPLLIRSIAMEGAIGPVASASHHGMVMRMPGIPVIAPMTPGEWLEGWNWFLEHDDPVYLSEHRRSFPIDHELDDQLSGSAELTLVAISAARLNAEEAVATLARRGIRCHLVKCTWLKPFAATAAMTDSLRRTGRGLVIDSDFEIAAAGRSIAYDLMHATGVPVHALGLEDRSAGFAPRHDNGTPSAQRIVERVEQLLGAAGKSASG